MGMPLVESEPDSPVGRAFMAAAEEIIARATIATVESAAAAAAEAEKASGHRSLPIVN